MKIVTHIGSVRADNVSLAVQDPGSHAGAIVCVLSMLKVMALTGSMFIGSSVSHLRRTSDTCHHVQCLCTSTLLVLITENREEYYNLVAYT